MADEVSQTTEQQAATGRRCAYCIQVTFLVLAVILLADPWPYKSPIPPMIETPAWAVDTTPVRRPPDHMTVQVAGHTYVCSDCHGLLPSSVPEKVRALVRHRNLKLHHGINSRCFNCHNPFERDVFAANVGQAIPYDQTPLLCAKCHGPVYRDWTHGSHGRTNGYWDASRGPVHRLKCPECHDPHDPAFRPMRPAPPPNTLRMGNQTFEDQTAEDVRNPLLIYLYPKRDDAQGKPFVPGVKSNVGSDGSQGER